MHKRERYAKLFGTILCEMFAILTIIYLLADGEADRLALAFGTLLPVDGYIDIGLIDTMLDMLLETVGAIAACMIILLDKDRHPIIQNHTTL